MSTQSTDALSLPSRIWFAMPAVPDPSPRPSPPGPEPAPPVPPRKGGRGWWLLAGAAAVGLAALAAFQANTSGGGPGGPILRTVTAAPGELEKTLRIGGTVAAKNFVAVRAPQQRGPRDARGAQMTLAKLAPSGSKVRKGEVVAEFELQWLVDHIDDVNSDFVQAKSEVDKKVAENMILRETDAQAARMAKAEADKAELDLRTAPVKSEIEAEILKNVAAEAEATAAELEQELEVKERVHEATVKGAELAAGEERLHLERHERDLVRLRLTTPLGGLVVMETVYKGGGQFKQTEEGDQIYPGALFMRIVDTSEMVVSASVNQVDVQAVRIGQRARIQLDAYPELVLDGRISSIGAIAGAGGGSRFGRGGSGLFLKNVPVDITIETSDERVIPDLSAGVDITLDQQPADVLLPREAVKTSAEGANVVYVRRGEGFEERTVELGEYNDTHVIVETGVESGEEVLIGEPPDA